MAVLALGAGLALSPLSVRAQAPESYGPVQRSETLWKVATQLGRQGVPGTVAQIAWGLYRFNPEGFEGSPNRIRAGAVLFVPDRAFVTSVPAADAFALVTGKQPVPAAPPVAARAPAAAVAPVPGGAFAASREHAEVQQRLAAGQRADEIYRFLAPLEPAYAGDVEFDYRLGTSAFDSGRFSEAIFVLERAVSKRPGFAGARMELARSYYALGDNESARREFVTLRDQAPPPEAARVIAEYLRAIDRRAAVYQTQQGAYLELASGYDSNANAAPDTRNFLGFTLDSRNQSTDSSYYSLGLGGALSHPFAAAWRLLGNAQAGYRSNPDASFVDSQVARVGGGLEWRPAAWAISLQPNLTYAMLDGEENHQALGVDAAATWSGSATNQASMSLRYAQQRYADTLEVLDVDTLLYGIALQTAVSPRLQLVSALTAGTDEAVQTGSPFGRDLFGARTGLVANLGNGHALTLTASHLSADYDGLYFLSMARSDDQFGGSIAYEWSALRAAGWTVGAQVNYVDNGSTVDLYDYDRIEAGVSLRRELQ